MKTCKKMAAIALLIGTSQAFASESLLASWQPPELSGLQASAMEPMSANELSGIKGGKTFYSTLSSNQITIAITGFTALVAGGIGNIFIQVDEPSSIGSKMLDTIICQGGFKLVGTLVGQSQISGANVDPKRDFGPADVGLSLGAGLGLAFLANGCSRAVYALDHGIMLAKKTGLDIEDLKTAAINAEGTVGRKLLRDKWNEQDRWFMWALNNGVQARDNIEEAAADQSELRSTRFTCNRLGIFYTLCLQRGQDYMAKEDAKILENSVSLKKWAIEAGKAMRERGNSIRLQYSKNNHSGNITYEIH